MLTEIEKRAEEAAVEILVKTGWMKWHDWFVTSGWREDPAERVAINAEVFAVQDKKVLYIEGRFDDKVVPVMVTDRTISGDRYISCEYENRHVVHYLASRYNESWRLWTAMPDEEQREAWKWKK